MHFLQSDEAIRNWNPSRTPRLSPARDGLTDINYNPGDEQFWPSVKKLFENIQASDWVAVVGAADRHKL